ncbi:hypothetical protein CfE428DRAFT_1610 [Chthoniobacter flavus Ellin428]|uniref:GYF domain-containing protein n=1 Tax=Chthoniobacter flavus Ellin428 TaxID=497964 RepID=B4CWZ7_9BACT|nr:trypsin-like peptidase domain-containing protein [Chthoniobacter flavus]EDY21317.1 hypothetical protein CfE428DRAFT_1610 [Chthoniobacter flavus Ellin428]TCO84914.1 hypothetical protein EV701_13334 [Chthoniobacter flavus]
MNGSPPAETVAYHVSKDGVVSGPYSEMELREGVASGRFATGDLVHGTGQADWLPLDEILAMLKPAQTPQARQASPPVAPGDVPDWRSILKWAWTRLCRSVVERGLTTGAICLLLGLLALALSRWPVVFWAPWLAIAVVAGVVLLRGGRKVTGALLLLAVILLPWLCHHYIMSKLPAEKTEPVTRIEPAEPLPVEESRPKGPVAAAPSEPVSAPVVVSATPAPLPVAAPVAVHAPTSAALPAPAASMVPATPVPDSFLTKAGKLAGSVVPYLKKAGESLPKLPDFSKKKEPQGNVQPNGDVIVPGAAEDLSTMLLHRDSIAAVKDGAEIIGNGFICRMGNQTWLFSNTHLLGISRPPRFVLLDGEMLTPDAVAVAAGPDVFRFPVAKAPEHVFEAMPDLGTAVQIGDGLMVMGNAQGGGVVSSWQGTVTGVGPDQIEVSAPFAPGTSGSPIIHLKTGKVIGIATYSRRPYDEFGNDVRLNGTKIGRHFGYRIDKIPGWEPVNPGEFYAEADKLWKISQLTEDIFNFYESVSAQTPTHYRTDTLRVAGMQWEQKVNRHDLSSADRVQAGQTFLNGMAFMVKADVKAVDGHLSYTYFRNRLEAEIKVREKLFEQLKPLLEAAGHK